MKEFIEMILLVICSAAFGGIITLIIAGRTGMIKDEYMDYIFEEDEEPIK